jgi:hypothetical protein
MSGVASGRQAERLPYMKRCIGCESVATRVEFQNLIHYIARVFLGGDTFGERPKRIARLNEIWDRSVD